jgi:putative transposase
MAKASGCARFAYNWALAEWQKEYAAGKKPNEAAMRRSLNAVKATEFPWMLEVTKCAPQMAIKDLGKAFQNFFAKRAGYPKFKKKASTIVLPCQMIKQKYAARGYGFPIWVSSKCAKNSVLMASYCG